MTLLRGLLLFTGMLLFSLTGEYGCISAQQAIPAAGGNASGSGGTVSWSAGQTSFSSFAGINGTVSEGVQQPYEISVISGARLPEITLQCRVFPNPTEGPLVLETGVDTGTFAAILVDQRGRVINRFRAASATTSIDLSPLAPAAYYLKVTRNGRPVKTFKIIRN